MFNAKAIHNDKYYEYINNESLLQSIFNYDKQREKAERIKDLTARAKKIDELISGDTKRTLFDLDYSRLTKTHEFTFN